MNTKLTLRLETAIVKKAKGEARRRGKSVSQMVAEYFDLLENPHNWQSDLPPITSSLVGILKDINEEDYHRHLREKHI